MGVGQKSHFENFHFCPTPGELCPGSTGPAHTVEARPDPLNIGKSVCTYSKAVENVPKEPSRYIWRKVH